ARFEYIHAVIDGYTETGGSGWALTISDQSDQSANTVMGGQISKNMSMSWGILTPSVHAEWQHQFKDNSRGILARFAGATAGTGFFRVITESPDRNYFNAGASLAATFQQGISAFLRYEGRFDQDNISNHAFELGMRVPF
ncbi:MAG: autotransporter outer membrane beta-barrel domain-containing protein, partial [Gammaproteobacteria bacterium]